MNFIKKYPSSKRYLSIFAIIILVVPIFIIGVYAGEVGKYISLSAYLLMGIFGAYEFLKNLSVTKYVAFIISLIIVVAFFFPISSFNSQLDSAIDASKNTTNPLSSILHNAFNWKSLLIVAFSPILLLLDKGMYENVKRSLVQVLFASITLILISIFVKFVWVVNISGNPLKILYFLPIAIIADSFGYFGGKYFKQYFWNGKKMAPKLSPKKTWAGFIIGYIFSALFVGLAGWQMSIFSGLENDIVILILATFILPIISILGDLLFSGIKRFLGIKDFSNLIPGHGGVMDRIDAMSSVIFVIFLIFMISS